jgi:Kef-type K+ transport system membrane component KefB
VGTFAIACAASDDLSAWCLLAVITVVARPQAGGTALPGRFAALAGYLAVMVLLVRPVLRRLIPASAPLGLTRFGLTLVFPLVSVWATEALEVHALFGAFLAGVVMPKVGKLEEELRAHLEPVTLALFLPLFFAYTGLHTSIALLNSLELWLICGFVVVTAVGSKLVVTALIGHAGGMSWRESLGVGVLMNTKGLIELVILNVGLDLHILSPALFSMMVVMALATTIMTTPLLNWVLPRRAYA